MRIFSDAIAWLRCGAVLPSLDVSARPVRLGEAFLILENSREVPWLIRRQCTVLEQGLSVCDGGFDETTIGILASMVTMTLTAGDSVPELLTFVLFGLFVLLLFPYGWAANLGLQGSFQ